ncbi:hypothetical protein [Streptomyces sp. NPDC056669]|uniref:hypothetical protein n=1 Tax=unclassified Streptomyces TaxID=2593676 RepID=UPI0036C50750
MAMTSVNPMNGAVLTTAMRDFLAHASIELVTNGQPARDDAGAFEPATLAQTTAKALIADPDALAGEHFGPSTVLVTYESESELEAAIHALPPWLRNANPDRIPRRVDGVPTDEPIGEAP